MTRLQINCAIGCGDIFVPGKLFALGSIVLHADSAGRLDQIMQFGSLEYIADSRGDLALSGWIPDRLENASSNVALTPELTNDRSFGPYLAQELISEIEPVVVTLEPASSTDATTASSDLDLESSPT